MANQTNQDWMNIGFNPAQIVQAGNEKIMQPQVKLGFRLRHFYAFSFDDRTRYSKTAVRKEQNEIAAFTNRLISAFMELLDHCLAIKQSSKSRPDTANYNMVFLKRHSVVSKSLIYSGGRLSKVLKYIWKSVLFLCSSKSKRSLYNVQFEYEQHLRIYRLRNEYLHMENTYSQMELLRESIMSAKEELCYYLKIVKDQASTLVYQFFNELQRSFIFKNRSRVRKMYVGEFIGNNMELMALFRCYTGKEDYDG